MLSIEAAGNSELLSRTNALQARREAQDFRHCMRMAGALFVPKNVNVGMCSNDGRKSKRDCQP